MQPALDLLWTEVNGSAKRLVIVALIFVLGTSVVSGLVPMLVKLIVDRLESGGPHDTYLAIFYLIASYSFAHWLSRSLGELRGMFHGRADQRIQRQLSEKLFRHVMSLPLRFHLDRRTGALTRTLTDGLLGYRIILHHLTLTVLPVVVEIVTMSAVLLALGHGVFLIIISVSVLFYILAFQAAVMRVGKPARAASSAHIDANAVLADSILNYETIKYFGAEAQVQGRFAAMLVKTEDQWAELFRRKMENGLVVASIFALSLTVTMYVATHDVRQGTMSIGTFVLINTYILQITRPLEMLGFAFRDIAQGIAFMEKMGELFDQKQEADDIEHRASLPTTAPDLAFNQVFYAYHNDHFVLKDVSFVVQPGRTTAIVGDSGSGKSSLVRLLMRFVEPNAGQICLNRVPLFDISRSVLREAIAVVPQDIALFNDSIAYNIGIGRQDSTEAEVVWAAKVAHIHDFIVSLPDGYDTRIGERGLKLSGGERQRIAIARAVVKRPKIFVFDEATSSLDSRTERDILYDLMSVASTTTTLIIAHRLSTIVHAEDIIVLDRGSVVERGTHNELLRLKGQYAAMWHMQRHGSKIPQDNRSIAYR